MKRIRMQLFATTICAMLVVVTVSLVLLSRMMRLTEENQEIYLRNSLSQVAYGVESILKDVESTTYNFAYGDEVQKLLRDPYVSGSTLQNYSTAYNSVSTIINFNKNILGIVVIPAQAEHYFNFHLNHQYRYICSIREDILEEKNRYAHFNGVLSNEFGDNEGYYTFWLPVYCTEQSQHAQIGQYLGTCVTFCRKSALKKVLEAALLDKMSIELYAGETQILFADRMPAECEEEESHDVLVYDLGEPSMWRIQQNHHAESISFPFPAVIALTLVVSVMVLLALAYIVHRNFSLPILHINRELMRIADRPLEPTELKIDSKNELNSITQSINTLLRHLQQSHEKQVEQESHMLRAQLSVNQLQLALLQNQINPHFLYNTLAMIRGIALVNGVTVIADIVTNMATLYRYSIKGGAYVQVRNEIDIVNRYLEIMNLRMDNKFKIEVDIAPELKEMWIAKMILQPLTENAIFHGLESKDDGGYLRINAQNVQENAFEISIYDNGFGIEPQMLQHLNEMFECPITDQEQMNMSAKGMGLMNVHRKIRMLHGTPYGLKAESVYGEWTKITVLLPCVTEKPK